MKKLIIGSILLSGLTLVTSAQAATLDDVVRSINNLRDYIAGAVNSTMKTVSDLIYEENPSLPATVTGNEGINKANINTQALTNNLSLEATKKALTLKSDQDITHLASITASDTFVPPTGVSIFGGNRSTANPDFGNSSFNLNSLLAMPAYFNYDAKNINQNPAYNFISAVSGLYQPISPTINFEGLNEKQKLELQSTLTYQQYQAALRGYIAAQSVGISNLYHLYAERIPQAGLGTAAGVTDDAGKPIANASALQVEQYLATRRSQNKNWYQQMAAASPTTVSRETLFVLAEIREQLFQLQLQNERLLATLSVMQLQNTQANKLNLQQLEQGVDAQIKKDKGISPTSGVPTNLNIPGIQGQ